MAENWAMEKINQRFRQDQIQTVDGLIDRLESEGIREPCVNRSTIFRLCVDLGLAVLEEMLVPEMIAEIQSERLRKFENA